MLVQLSDWQQTPTSLRIQKSKRKKQNNDHSSSFCPATLISFVKNQRFNNHSSKRRKGALQDDKPCLVLTSSHQISVIKYASGRALQESEQMQYSCRPGIQSSFLHEPCAIPAIFAENRFYAVQNKNTSVISWSSQSLGPDDENAAHLTLDEPLLCLHHSSSFVYGTLQNSGSLFVGVVKKSNQTVMEKFVFEPPIAQQQLRHVCTTVLEVPNNDYDVDRINHIGSKRKRKQQLQRLNETFRLVQVFLDKENIVLVQHELRMDCQKTEVIVDYDEGETMVAKMPLPPHSCIDSVSFTLHKNSTIALLIEEESNVKKVEVVAHKKKKQKNGVIVKKSLQGVTNPPKRSFVLCLSIEDGVMLGSFDVPLHSRLVGFVRSNVLAIANDKSPNIEMHEIQHGESIQKLILNDAKVDNLMSISDTTDGEQRLVLLKSRGKTAEIFSAMLEPAMGKGSEMQTDVISLADGLRCCMESDTKSSTADEPKDLMVLLDGSEGVIPTVPNNNGDSALMQALASLETASNCITDPTEENLERHFLLDAYEDALSILSVSKEATTLENGPKSESGETKKKRFMNEKFLDRCHTPNTIPQSFVDGALRLVLKILLVPFDENRKKLHQIKLNAARLDARLLLYRLIETKKVSARQHFGFEDESTSLGSSRLWRVLKATKLTKKGYQRQVSPVDLMHVMLSNCSDLTEHHLLTMIHYSMIKTLPEDIASDILDRHFIFKDSSPARQYSNAFFRARSSLFKLQKSNQSPNGSNTAEKLEKELDDLCSKLWYEGLCFIVQRVLTYTPVVNETLLRLAISSLWNDPKSTAPRTFVGVLKQVWDREQEVILQADGSSEDPYHGWSNSSHVMVNALKWILVVLETTGINSDVTSIKSKVSKSLRLCVTSTQHLVDLQPLLQAVCTTLPKHAKASSEAGLSSGNENDFISKVGKRLISPLEAGYCIETLII
mmetsp:Transcript_10783/g.16554  ORF Transcript_10783/g.16554 Transcript_10783/m.16554 type:complete len:950 (-) Transcript_10783:19-2868(-)